MSSKIVVSVIAKQIQTLLKEIESRLQLVMTAENNNLYSIQHSIAIDYDKLTPEALQTINVKLLEIYQELCDSVRIEQIEPFIGLNSPSFPVSDNPHVPPMRGAFNTNPYCDLGRPQLRTEISPSEQHCLYDEVNWLIQNPIPHFIVALFERYFRQGSESFQDGISYVLNKVNPPNKKITIAKTNKISTDIEFLRILLNYPINQLQLERIK